MSDMDPVQPASPIYPIVSPAATESTFARSPITTKQHDGLTSYEPPRKKQKRNKPTLSCEECVERKTKVGLSFDFYLLKASLASIGTFMLVILFLTYMEVIS
jgi:hypothetical protein